MHYRNVPEIRLRGELSTAYGEAHALRWETLNLDLETVTPVYGGGVEAGQVDPELAFRPRALRNGMRHWWWLLNRHRFADSLSLFEEMALIWGAASTEDCDGASKVRVRIVGKPSNVRVTAFAPYLIKEQKKDNAPAKWTVTPDASHPDTYALFGARGQMLSLREIQGMKGNPLSALALTPGSRYPGVARYSWGDDECLHFDALAKCERIWKGQQAANGGQNSPGRHVPAQLIRAGAQFALRVDIAKSLTPMHADGVLQAIIFWIRYGGIGARSSRGLGRLKCRDLGDAPTALKTGLMKSFPELPADWTMICSTQSFNDPMAAMRGALDVYKSFRQARGQGAGRPGRSFFPDADTVRTLKDSKLTLADGTIKHQVRHPYGKTHFSKPFFGGPVVIKYKDDKPNRDYPQESVRQYDPQQTTLSLGTDVAPHARYASPVLTIPLQSGEKYVAAILVLPYRNDISGTYAGLVTNSPSGAAWDQKIAPGTWWPTKAGEGAKVLTWNSRQQVDAKLRAVSTASSRCDDPIQAFVAYARKCWSAP